MAQNRDSSPVYYREIQKNAYLKRIPDEVASKPLGLRPLGLNKKAPLKPLWTQLCVHNGRTPYLEQYRDPVSARAHRPVWRASLMTARHVTASVTVRDTHHDFLVDTEHGPVRMLAPDWETMQDWVTSLRATLLELKIVPACENVYCGAPRAAPVRAAARDPTSPLPPPPAIPDRIPGIDLTSVNRSNTTQTTIPNHQQQPETTLEEPQQPVTTSTQNVPNSTSSVSTSSTFVQSPSSSSTTSENMSNAAQKVLSTNAYTSITTSISNSSTFSTVATTSNQETFVTSPNMSKIVSTTSVTGSNVSNLSRNVTENNCTGPNMSTTRTNVSKIGLNSNTGTNMSTVSATNVSKSAPHMSKAGLNMSKVGSNMSNIPNLSIPAETVDISNWETVEAETFTSLPSTSQVPKSVTKICGQNICLDDSIFKRTCHSDDEDFLSEDKSSLGSKSGSLSGKSDLSSNLDKIGNKSDKLGSKSDSLSRSDSLGSKNDSEVNSYKQTVVVNDKRSDSAENSASDRSTNITVIQVSNKDPPHTAIPVIGSETDVFDFNFKSAPRNPNYVNIVNTEVNVQNTNEYGTVFTKNEPEYGHISLTTTVSLTGDVKSDVNVLSEEVKSNVNIKNDSEGLYEKLCLASTSKEVNASPLPLRKLKSQEKMRKSSLPNLDTINSDPLYEYLFLSQNSSSATSSNHVAGTSDVATRTSNVANNRINVATTSSHISTRTIDTDSSRGARNDVATRTNDVATRMTDVATNRMAATTTSNVTVNSESNANNSRVHINGSILDPNTRVLRSNVERSNSQNAYDVSPRREARIDSGGLKRNAKVEKIESVQPKPIWKRGLTELSLLTRLRGITHGKRHDSPDRQHDRNAVTSPSKVVHRSRPETRVDRNRRRSSSLSNGQSPPSTSVPPSLQPLRARQAAALRSEQRRGAAIVATCRTIQPPVFVDYNKQVWVAWWGAQGARFSGRAGDRVCGVRGVMPRDSAHAKELFTTAHAPTVDILFHRVPLGKIYVISKRDQESIGIKIDSECNLLSGWAESGGGAGTPPPPAGKWAVTELNNRPLQLTKVDPEEVNRLTLRGTEASVLIQPAALVKKLRAALKGNKSLLGLR